jgi:8-oxo-dGTP pyrophosphatase MutT (NUDIX family)
MASVPGAIRQAAAIPLKEGQVCLVTSSSGRRWIIPKGLIDRGKTAGEIALQEAWEEAGLVGTLMPEPVGSYLYEKYGGIYYVTVFLMQVTEAVNDWPESNLRRRCWMNPTQALTRIEERGLREIVRGVMSELSIS